MKKVLMIAHQFPPIGGSGVQRTVKFVKYLPSFNWKAEVFTRKVKGIRLSDHSLMEEIPENTPVYRSRAADCSEWIFPLNLAGKFIRRRVLIPDGERLWAFFGKRQAAKILENKHFDILYSTSQPFSTHILAMHLKEKFPYIPWVVDFRDEWTNNSFVKDYGYNLFRINKEKKMERSIFEKADAIVINTPVMRDNSVRDNPHLAKKFNVIPNGFDQTDFEGLRDEKPKNDKFTITYTGLIYGNTSPETVFKALKILVSKGDIPISDIRLRFIGRLKTNVLMDMARRYEVDGAVEALPYMLHRESIQSLLDSDAVLLLLGPGTESIYTGKLMEYINTGRPILASVTKGGAAAGLIRETKTGYIADCSDIKETAGHILRLYLDWKQGKSSISPDLEQVKRYERRELTKNLVEVFNKVI